MTVSELRRAIDAAVARGTLRLDESTGRIIAPDLGDGVEIQWKPDGDGLGRIVAWRAGGVDHDEERGQK